MKCLKCGKNIQSDRVFCEPCLEDMQRHPVKPGTPVVLPNRPERTVVTKSSRKRVRKPDEQIANLKAIIFWLILLVMVLVTAVFVTVTLLLDATEVHRSVVTALVENQLL